MEHKTCFFIGHHDAPETILPLIYEAVERHISKYGVREFVVGHYGRFDSLAAHAVREAKKHYPKVILTLLTPYYPYTNDTSGYDRTFYPPGMEDVPKPFAIVRANEHMIKTSDYLICYDAGLVGNTGRLVKKALRRQKKGEMRVENLAETRA